MAQWEDLVIDSDPTIPIDKARLLPMKTMTTHTIVGIVYE